MNKKNIKLFFIVGSILLCCFFSTIAYSALYLTMDISGIAYARPVKDVRITDFKINSLSGGATVSYEEFSSNTISTKIHLVDGYSIARFDVEVTNYGNVDVGILNITNDTDADVRFDLSNYNLTEKLCDENSKCNNMAVKTFQIEFSGIPGDYELIYTFDFRTYHDVTYTDITNNNYPTEVIDGGILNINFTEDLNRVLVLSNGVEVNYYDQISNGQTITINNVTGDIEIKKKEPVATLVSGKIDEIGSEVCIKDECFYIISNDGTTVSMLAKYNLYVGGKYENNVWTAYGDEATGLQNPSMKGYVSTGQPYNGTTVFSSDTQKGTYYSYYQGSIVEGYVNTYKNALERMGAPVKEARLIVADEYSNSETFACTGSSCSNAYTWFYSTSYWTGSPSYDFIITTISSDGKLQAEDYNYMRDGSYDCGVRPVIEMSIDDIKLPKKIVMVSGDYDTVGSEACIEEECFYVISSTDDTVTMLAKNNITLEDYPKQSSSAGATVFSSDGQKGTYYSDYNGSIVEGYVNNYSRFLKTYGISTIEARLITYDEVSSLGCTFDVVDGMCEGEYKWAYSIGYWTGTSYSSETIIQISKEGLIGEAPYYIEARGVRPVITVSKDYF